MAEADVARLLSTMVLAYGKEPPTGEAVDAYLLVLGKYSPDVLKSAMYEAYARHTWLPKPSELKVICDEIQSLVDDEERENRVYWRGIALWNAMLSGLITREEYDADGAIKHMRRQYGDRSWWSSADTLRLYCDSDTETVAKPDPPDLAVVYSYCPSCECRQYAVVEGSTKTCMACHKVHG